MAEHEASTVVGGGGIAEHDESAVAGGGGMAEHEASTVVGGGGMAEHDESAVAGGGGMIGAERTGLLAVAHEYRPATMDVRLSSSSRSSSEFSRLSVATSAGNPADRAALAPNSILFMVRLIAAFGKCPWG
jgi:hypothetical protein